MGLTNRLKALLAHREEYTRWEPKSHSIFEYMKDWQDLSNYYMSKGVSKSKAYEKVAEQYGTTRGTLIYWLTPGYREKCLAKNRNPKQKS